MTDNKYPNDKIIESYIYIENFQTDIDCMTNILENITIWNNRGINLESCNEPLNNQIELWKTTMDNLINEFKNNITILKEHDDRIKNTGTTSENTINIDVPEGSIMEQWQYLYDIYEKIYINLNEDIDILNNALADLNNYNKIGVELGNVNEVINTQITNITNGINESLTGLDNIINKIKDESKKILTEDELIAESIQMVQSYDTLAINAYLPEKSVDGNSLKLDSTNNPYFDITKLKTHVTSFSDETVTNMDISTNEKQWKYIYIGKSKETIKEYTKWINHLYATNIDLRNMDNPYIKIGVYGHLDDFPYLENHELFIVCSIDPLSSEQINELSFIKTY